MTFIKVIDADAEWTVEQKPRLRTGPEPKEAWVNMDHVKRIEQHFHLTMLTFIDETVMWVTDTIDEVLDVVMRTRMIHTYSDNIDREFIIDLIDKL